MTTRSIVYQKSALCLLLILIFLPTLSALAANSPEEVKVDWQKQERVSKTTASLEILTFEEFAVAPVMLPEKLQK